MNLPVIEVEKATPWYAQGLRFGCTQCGNCCTGGPGFVWVSPGEIEALAAFLALSVEETIQRYCRRIGSRISLQEFPSPAGEYDCVFLKTENGKRTCKVYALRPLQCRTWPFWDGNLASAQAWQAAARRCPGIGTGVCHSQAQIEERRDQGTLEQTPKE